MAAVAGPAHNQTVEEILASIRLAITEDEVRRGAPRSRPDPAEPSSGNVSSLFAAEPRARMIEAAPASSGGGEGDAAISLAIEKAIDGVRAELTTADDESQVTHGTPPPAGPPLAVRPSREGAPQPEPRGPPAPARKDDLRPQRPLLSPRAGAAVSASFDNLARSMAAGGGRSLDELVEAILRPMLRTWLDENLPPLVERLIREEIERVSRGGR
ncbi:MAG: DUF2497 domain-containing protein [Bauldia sp.]